MAFELVDTVPGIAQAALGPLVLLFLISFLRYLIRSEGVRGFGYNDVFVPAFYAGHGEKLILPLAGLISVLDVCPLAASRLELAFMTG